MSFVFGPTCDWFGGRPLGNDDAYVCAELTDDFVCCETLQELQTFAQGPVKGNPNIPVMDTTKLRIQVPLNMIGSDVTGPSLGRIGLRRNTGRRRRMR